MGVEGKFTIKLAFIADSDIKEVDKKKKWITVDAGTFNPKTHQGKEKGTVKPWGKGKRRGN